MQGRARRRSRPGQFSVDLVLGAVGQQEQQSGQISLGHRGQQPNRHAVPWKLRPRGRLERRHERPLFVLSTNPRLPLLTCKTDTGDEDDELTPDD